MSLVAQSPTCATCYQCSLSCLRVSFKMLDQTSNILYSVKIHLTGCLNSPSWAAEGFAINIFLLSLEAAFFSEWTNQNQINKSFRLRQISTFAINLFLFHSEHGRGVLLEIYHENHKDKTMLSDAGAQRKGVPSQPSSTAAQSGEGAGGRLPWMWCLLHWRIFKFSRILYFIKGRSVKHWNIVHLNPRSGRISRPGGLSWGRWRSFTETRRRAWPRLGSCPTK